MAEYIEREAALSFPFAHGQYDHENADPHFINGCKSYREWLETIPAADVVPVRHGRWIWTETGNTDYEQFWICSECKDRMYYQTRYCPNCGARMDGDGNE